MEGDVLNEVKDLLNIYYGDVTHDLEHIGNSLRQNSILSRLIRIASKVTTKTLHSWDWRERGVIFDQSEFIALDA
jgi:hypothetical protein